MVTTEGHPSASAGRSGGFGARLSPTLRPCRRLPARRGGAGWRQTPPVPAASAHALVNADDRGPGSRRRQARHQRRYFGPARPMPAGAQLVIGACWEGSGALCTPMPARSNAAWRDLGGLGPARRGRLRWRRTRGPPGRACRQRTRGDVDQQGDLDAVASANPPSRAPSEGRPLGRRGLDDASESGTGCAAPGRAISS